MAQLAQRFNQLLLDGVHRLDRTVRIPGQVQDGLKARPQFGMLPQRFEELLLGRAELAARLLFHPHFIGGTGDLWRFFQKSDFAGKLWRDI